MQPPPRSCAPPRLPAARAPARTARLGGGAPRRPAPLRRARGRHRPLRRHAGHAPRHLGRRAARRPLAQPSPCTRGTRRPPGAPARGSTAMRAGRASRRGARTLTEGRASRRQREGVSCPHALSLRLRTWRSAAQRSAAQGALCATRRPLQGGKPSGVRGADFDGGLGRAVWEGSGNTARTQKSKAKAERCASAGAPGRRGGRDGARTRDRWASEVGGGEAHASWGAAWSGRLPYALPTCEHGLGRELEADVALEDGRACGLGVAVGGVGGKGGGGGHRHAAPRASAR